MSNVDSNRNENLVSEIRPFRRSKYVVDVGFNFLESWLDGLNADYGTDGRPGLNLDPDFQRGHVWSDTQRSRYVEYILRGGNAQIELQWNHPNWDSSGATDLPVEMQIIDGKQRLEAVRKYIRGEIAVFGRYVHEYAGTDFDIKRSLYRLKMNVHDMKTRKEVLQFYLDLNSGGVIHSDEEIDRVRALLAAAG